MYWPPLTVIVEPVMRPASDDAGLITGSTMTVNGGQYIA